MCERERDSVCGREREREKSFDFLNKKERNRDSKREFVRERVLEREREQEKCNIS